MFLFNDNEVLNSNILMSSQIKYVTFFRGGCSLTCELPAQNAIIDEGRPCGYTNLREV